MEPARRRLLVFLGLFSALALLMFLGSGLLAERAAMRIRGHVVVGWAGAVPMALYLFLSLRHFLRAPGPDAGTPDPGGGLGKT